MTGTDAEHPFEAEGILGTSPILKNPGGIMKN